MSSNLAQHYINERIRLWGRYQDLDKDLKFRHAIAQEIKVNPVLLNELAHNPELLIPMQYIIVNKDSEVVPFFPNKAQKYVLGRINKAKAEYKAGTRNSMKFRCLKGRQQGITAIITAYQLAHVLLKPNFSGFTMADTSDNANVILNDKAKYPYNNLPDIIKPEERFNSRNELFFGKMNSSWRTASAESGDAGRSRTINFFHASEVGSWSNYSNIIAAIKPAITKNSIIFEETTAQGHNEFYDNWFDEESDYENIFLQWWQSDEYELPFESKEIQTTFKKAVNDELSELHAKLKLLKAQGLTWAQIYWYYTESRTLKGKMPQEYPCTEQEAFLYSGSNFFDLTIMNNNILSLTNYKPLRVEDNKRVVIFEEPEENERYYIGADVAEGLANADYSHAKIIRSSDCAEVAYIHGHYSTDAFGRILVKYAKYYNNAFLGIENNNHGHAVLNTVYIYQGYKNIFQQHMINRKVDRPERGKKLGWNTNTATKFIMLDELQTAINEESYTIRDIEFFKEAMSVVSDDRGDISINGKDRVAAAAIAYQMRKYHRKKNAMAEHYKQKALAAQESLVLQTEQPNVHVIEDKQVPLFSKRHIG